MTEQERSKGLFSKSEKYVKLLDVLKLVEESICDLESNSDKDMFIEDINKLETKELRIKEK